MNMPRSSVGTISVTLPAATPIPPAEKLPNQSFTPHSIVGLLPIQDFQVQRSTPNQAVLERFQQTPHLSGVIVLRNSQLIGVISRAYFFEKMILGAAANCLDLAIQTFIPTDAVPLVVPDTCSVIDAAHKALTRSSGHVADPIVVRFRDGSLRLLSLTSLMAAQTKLVTDLQAHAQQQQFRLETAQTEIQVLNQDLSQHIQTLDQRNHSLQTQQQHLEQQQSELIELRSENLSIHNALDTVQQILASQNEHMTKTVLASITEFSKGAQKILSKSIELAKELEGIQTTAHLIKQVGKQARVLGLQTAILTNRFGDMGLDALSRFTNDIARLVNQAVEVDEQMGESVDRIRYSIGELAQTAQTHATATQTLITAVYQLDPVAIEPDKARSGYVVKSDIQASLSHASSLMRQVEQVAKALEKLYQNPNGEDLRLVIRNLEHRLKYYRLRS